MRLRLPISILASSYIASTDAQIIWQQTHPSKIVATIVRSLFVLSVSAEIDDDDGEKVCTADDTSPECLNQGIAKGSKVGKPGGSRRDKKTEAIDLDDVDMDSDDGEEEEGVAKGSKVGKPGGSPRDKKLAAIHLDDVDMDSDEDEKEDIDEEENDEEENDDDYNYDYDYGDEEDGNDDNEVNAMQCNDKHESCKEWSRSGRCTDSAHAVYMLTNCPKSCNICLKYRANDFGEPQLIPTSNSDEVEELLKSTETYMKLVLQNPMYKDVREICRNNDSQCSKWAVEDGGCDEDPHFMKLRCGPACKSCTYLMSWNKFCKPDPNDEGAVRPGELNKLFENMIAVANKRGFEPKIWSRPANSLASPDSPACEEDIANPFNASDGPWVLTIDNFLSDQEISTLLHWGAENGYESSTTTQSVKNHRTSSLARCSDECSNDPSVGAIREKLADITGIPEGNQENMQLLKYETGQHSKFHHDFLQSDLDLRHGPRVLSFIIYLGDVEDGGGTRFPRLDNLTIDPKRGRLLMWPAVKDDDLNAEDPRTYYEDLPVVAGKKFCAASWIHVKDFQKGLLKGCSLES